MSEQTDAVQEKELKELGLMYPRVTKEQIDNLMNQVEYHTCFISGTTTTIATAILPIGISKFTLAMTKSACVDPRNFNAKLGADYAIQDCVNAARDKLWELEGYHLAKTTAAIPTNFKDRVVLETNELKEKLDKLSDFISKGKPESINVHDWKLLRFQQKTMDEYYRILLARLDELK